MDKISLKGILIGILCMIVAMRLYITVLLGMPHLLHRYGIATEDSMGYLATTVFIGSLNWILGGYVGARIAKHDEVVNGTLTSLPMIGIAFYLIVYTDPQHQQTWAYLIAVTITVAFAALGGYLRLRQVRGKQLAG